jgi:aminopeptidase-like protein
MEAEILQLLTRLYPICRSLTGDGNRETLEIIREHIPLDIKEVPTGTKAFDWEVPKEWNIRDAWVKHAGKKVIDFGNSNLHVMGYSTPVNEVMSLEKLKKHLYTLPDKPTAIPYRTSYYKEQWGFCVSHEECEKLEDGEYEVFIDSELKDGSLTYGELYLEGKTKDEFLVSTYICHPSMCNDNLSGVVLSTFLAKELIKRDRYMSYRFLFVPETLGSIVWLSRNEDTVYNIKYGLIATCTGDDGCVTYKMAKNEDALINEIVVKSLQDSGVPHVLQDFYPWGSDDRQYSSPGFDMPVGSLMRTPYRHFSEYHTSLDDLNFVSADNISDSVDRYIDVVNIVESNKTYINKNPKCEPLLGKHGFYNIAGGQKKPEVLDAIRWILSLSGGDNSLLDISKRSGMEFYKIAQAAKALRECGLIEEIQQ